MSDCVLYVGYVGNHGYGVRHLTGNKKVLAHREAWEQVNGPISKGFVVDHTCHDPDTCFGGVACEHRKCINVEHLTLVTRADNVARDRSRSRKREQTECVHGHAFTPDNTYIYPRSGLRGCRTCRKRRAAEQNLKRRGR